MIVLTGGAGFIGSVLLHRLNQAGITDILVVDDELKGSPKQRNLEGKKLTEYVEKDEFIEQVRRRKLPAGIEGIFHLGACSSTTETDEDYLMNNNFQYSVDLCTWAMEKNIRFVYASSAATYGNGENGYSDNEAFVPKLKPLNMYGKSKQFFDMWVLNNQLIGKVAGLKYFNVFGPNEYHKGDMRSLICKAYQKVVKEKKIRLFKSYHPDFADGEQKRDFLYVKDAADATFFFWENKNCSGIYNIGTGLSHSWNELAQAIFKALDYEACIEYFEMPDIIKPNYQYYTEADVTKLRKAGFSRPFYSLEDSVADYLTYLDGEKIL